MLPLPTLGSAPQELYLRVSSSSSIGLPLKLIPAEQKDRLLASSWLSNGLIVGALLVMALFHLLKFATSPDRRLGYYCATIFSVAWYNASINDLTNLLLWRHLPWVAPFRPTCSVCSPWSAAPCSSVPRYAWTRACRACCATC